MEALCLLCIQLLPDWESEEHCTWKLSTGVSRQICSAAGILEHKDGQQTSVAGRRKEAYQQRQQEYSQQHRDISFDVYSHGLKAWQVYEYSAAQPEQVY